MWTYSQSTGELFDTGGTLREVGYSGKGAGKKNPDMQCVKDLGPIPRGYYTIGAPISRPGLAPPVLPLVPDANNQMCGRSGFLFHGDSVADPGSASVGCIIMGKATRDAINGSADKRLRVVAATGLTTRLRTARRTSRRRPLR